MSDKRKNAEHTLTPSRWEELCRRCGECCFEKWIDGAGTVYPTEVACCHLDIVTRECRVYDKRLEMGEGCIRLTPEVVKIVQWLPENCAYVEFVRGVKTTTETSPKRERRRKRRTGSGAR